MSDRVPVTFEPAGVTVWVASGATVLEAARLAGILLAAPCGGRGVCGSCCVRVVEGDLCAPDEQESAGIARAPAGVRLACRARVDSAVSVRPMILGPPSESTQTGDGPAGGAVVAGVDLGTTSIAAILIDPATGREVARSSVANPQQLHGADVLSRLSAALSGHGAALRAQAEAGISAALVAAASAAGVSTRTVRRLAIVGNTAMTALLAGADTSMLAVHPFVRPQVDRSIPGDSPVRGILADDAEVIVLPAIAGFVGGDALAGTLAAGLVDAERPALLVDFGTNAEVVLAGVGPLVVASTAAGPAFEGVGISCGGPAAAGAVTRVRIDGHGAVALETIESGSPRWFSGSGIVSLVAELRRRGHVDSTGRLLAEGPLSTRFSPRADGVLTVRLGEAAGCLELTQLDIRELQLAKAAVRVGVEAVLAAGGVTSGDLESVAVAGAFGSAMEPEDLVELGILPVGVAERTVRVGNAALDGAAIAALDPKVVSLAEKTARAARHVELAEDEGFARALLEATSFSRYSG